jgi:hypothetical protein
MLRVVNKSGEPVDDFHMSLLQSEWKLYEDNYNKLELMQFFVEHRVEVLSQSDCQYHCFIDYKEGDGSWFSSMSNPLEALVMGVKVWKKHNLKEES